MYRDGVMEMRCEAEVMLDRYAQALAPPIAPSLPSQASGPYDADTQSCSSNCSSKCMVRLPKLTLPEFESDSLEWPSL